MLEHILDTIRDIYETHPSRAMAISAKFAEYIYGMLSNVDMYFPDHDKVRVLDAGSGFSSYVTRIFEKYNRKIEVITIDTDQHYLNITANKLANHNLGVDNMCLADAYLTGKNLYGAALCIYDLGDYTQRIDYFHAILSTLQSGAIILFDDMQNADVHKAVMNLSKIGNYMITEFSDPIYVDRFGRHFAVGVNVHEQ